jgi:hypothetical protein
MKRSSHEAGRQHFFHHLRLYRDDHHFDAGNRCQVGIIPDAMALDDVCLISSGGDGSKATILSGLRSRFAASPRASAPPIFAGADAARACRRAVRSCFARCFEQARCERLFGRLAGPDHELEAGEIALARVDRELDQRLALRIAGAGPT